MSDRETRQLERAASQGDPEATEPLVRALERSGEEYARCRIVGHAYGEPKEFLTVDKHATCGPSEFPRRYLGPGYRYECRMTCASCDHEAAVHWAHRMSAFERTHWKVIIELEAILGRGDEGMVCMQADGTIQILDPETVSDALSLEDAQHFRRIGDAMPERLL